MPKRTDSQASQADLGPLFHYPYNNLRALLCTEGYLKLIIHKIRYRPIGLFNFLLRYTESNLINNQVDQQGKTSRCGKASLC